MNAAGLPSSIMGARSCGLAMCSQPAVEGEQFCAKHGPRIAQLQQRQAARKARKGTEKLSSQATQTASGVPQCPNCGGVSFKSRHSNKQRAFLGAGLVMPKHQVQCVTCGAKFKRG